MFDVTVITEREKKKGSIDYFKVVKVERIIKLSGGVINRTDDVVGRLKRRRTKQEKFR